MHPYKEQCQIYMLIRPSYHESGHSAVCNSLVSYAHLSAKMGRGLKFWLWVRFGLYNNLSPGSKILVGSNMPNYAQLSLIGPKY